MPIYEYQCGSCGRISSHVVLGSKRKSRPACPHCASPRTRRVMSSFAVVQSEASRLDNLDTAKPAGESYYRDSRNVGLWAKKRAKQLVLNLGPKFEEPPQNTRSGKLSKEP